MSRDLTPWSVDETDALRDWIANPKSMTQRQLATRLERSLASVRNKIAWLRGSPWSRKSSRPNYEPKAGTFGFTSSTAFERPTPRRNDDTKHLRLLLAALQQERAA